MGSCLNTTMCLADCLAMSKLVYFVCYGPQVFGNVYEATTNVCE